MPVQAVGSFARRPSRAVRGFTIIEVVVALAIVAVLAAIAVPSYVAHLRKAARVDAQSFLIDAAAREHQTLVDRRAYASSLASLAVTVPSSLTGKYTFTVATADGPPPSFTLTAQAVGDQTRDTCPTLAVDNLGNFSPSGCW